MKIDLDIQCVPGRSAFLCGLMQMDTTADWSTGKWETHGTFWNILDAIH